MMKEAKLKCPNCGHTRFRRRYVETVEIIDTGSMLTDDVISSDDCYDYECVGCGCQLDVDELVR